MNGIPWWYFFCHGGALEGRRLPALDPDDALRAAVGIKRTVGAVVYAACDQIEPGTVALRDRNARMIVGEPDGRLFERVQILANAFTRGGLPTTPTASIRHEIWAKLITNLASGPLSILTQCTLDRILAQSPCRDMARAAMEEAAAIAEALGRAPDRDMETKIARLGGLKHKPSILQDLEMGREMELETLYGVPLELAQLVGMQTPVLSLLVALARLRVEAARPS